MIVKTIKIKAPIERCFDLTRSIEFHAASSKIINARAIGGKISGLSDEGDKTTWRAAFFGCRFSMTTEISDFQLNKSYKESLIKGIPKVFRHHYLFEQSEGGCLLIDRFEFQTRFGVLGKIVDKFVMLKRMEFLVESRLDEIKHAAESDGWQNFTSKE